MLAGIKSEKLLKLAIPAAISRQLVSMNSRNATKNCRINYSHKFLSLVFWEINQSQYFEGVALNVREFFIGGYQSAQKWLKDRKGKILGFEEILHYQKIIVALSETDHLMREIDLVFKF